MSEHKGVTWSEKEESKEKEITETLLKNEESERYADEEVQDRQHTASETGKSGDGISSTKLREPGSTVGKNEGK